MPLLSIEHITEDVDIGIWRIDETLDFLVQHTDNPAIAALAREHKSPTRQRETFVEHILLHEMTKDNSLVIDHLQSGKPIVKDRNISVSHTQDYLSIIISTQRRVAIDIEYISDRVDRIAQKFIREDEHARSTMDKLVIWCAKETTYKYFSEQNLGYFDMRVVGFNEERQSNIVVENLKYGGNVIVSLKITDKYVMAYAY